MLTLKVITTDIDGKAVTHLLSGDAITHREYFTKDHCILSKMRENSPMVRCIGEIQETSSEQPFIVSEVQIYEDNHSYKNELFILPKAECYIMENGKTVDTFFCQFEQ